MITKKEYHLKRKNDGEDKQNTKKYVDVVEEHQSIVQRIFPVKNGYRKIGSIDLVSADLVKVLGLECTPNLDEYCCDTPFLEVIANNALLERNKTYYTFDNNKEYGFVFNNFVYKDSYEVGNSLWTSKGAHVNTYIMPIAVLEITGVTPEKMHTHG